jgi:hypothetical protein
MTAQQDANDGRLTMLLALRLGGVDHADAVAVLDEYDTLRRKAVLAEAADWLVKKYGVTNRAAGDLRRMADTPHP